MNTNKPLAGCWWLCCHLLH